MINKRPSVLILFGSLVFMAASFIFTLIVHLFIFSLNNLTIILIPLISGGLAYLIFYFLLKQFINSRLSQIYKSIQLKQQGTENSSNSVDRLMDNAEVEVANWKNERNIEITRLKEQEQFRREFLGNLAHELKTPVFSIQGYILTLLEGGLEDQNINRSFLERAAKGTDRMASILEDLDQITKLEVEELKNEIRSFDIIEVIKEIFESFEILAKSKEYNLKFAKEYSPTYVMADRTKISQVFSNLLGNALAYGIDKGTCSINLTQIEDFIEIEVSDDGPGIDEKHHNRLFERFYRVEKSRNRHEGGSGLGLAIVKHIIESHGHKIYLKSEFGVGTTFYFNLKKSNVSGPVSSRGVPLN